MAPTPVDNNNLFVPSPTPPSQPSEPYWTKATIAATTIFALLSLAISLLLLAFYLRKRVDRKAHATHHNSDKSLLLAADDKSTMFSRAPRNSSVNLFVDDDADTDHRRSQDSMPLVPLQISPLEQVHDPMGRATPSTGSGVSAVSWRSANTMSTLMLSPVAPGPEEGDMSVSVRMAGRPRSTSSASGRARYYESVQGQVERPPVPKIISTLSD